MYSNCAYIFIPGAIPFMVQCIKEALASSDRTHDGFHPTELAEGLGRMAVNDSNKMTVSTLMMPEQCVLPLNSR